MRYLIAALLATPLACGAQAYKCVEAGKTVYQSAPCAAGSQSSVSTQGNAGMTGDRQAADQMNVRQRQSTFNPDTCKFQYHKYGDGLGKSLAAAAKEECLSTNGQQGPAYTRWKDHFQMTSTRRDNALSRSQQQQQQQQQQQRNPQLDRQRAPSYSCRRSMSGGMDCDPR